MNTETRQILFYLVALSPFYVPVMLFFFRLFLRFLRYILQEANERMEAHFVLRREKGFLLAQARTLRTILITYHRKELVETFPLQMEPDDVSDLVDRYYNIMRQVYTYDDCPYGRNEFGFCRWMDKHGYDFNF